MAHCIGRRGAAYLEARIDRSISIEDFILTDVSLAAAEAERGSALQHAALRVEGLGKSVSLPDGELVILEDIAFRIAHGDTVAVVGASGSGKSTTIGRASGRESGCQSV